MKKTFTTILIFLSVFSTSAQISTDEQPISFRVEARGLALKEQQTDLRILPSLDMERIQEEDERDEQNGLPPRFGFPHDVSYSLTNSGTWTDLENGDRIWRLSIHCPGALSINLLYDQFWLPEKAKLFIYTNDRKHTIGAFTSVNNKGTRGELEGFATGLLYGNTITLEYYQPKDVQETGIISVARVVHGYRYINLPEFATEDLGSSGGCQVNVNCSEGANWQQEKNAVALILVGGTRMCTGSLINTTCNDDRPLFLTANHCLLGGDAISNPNLTTWSFYWHYESPTCSNPSTEPPHLSTSGATVIANNGNSDFALLELTEDPKDRNGVTPYYLGWDRSGTAGTGGVGIHHPAGDIKKIATYTISPANSDCFNFTYEGVYLPNGNFWKINWAATANGHSVTEGGSSGSPLVNSNRRIIGQLFGAGLCSNPNCSDPAQDIGNYGKFSVSWTGGGATDNRRRLDHWLNPGGGTAPNTIDGKAATILAGPDLLCTSETYTISNLPTGATVTGWTASPSSSVTFSGSGNSRTITRSGTFRGEVTVTATVSTACGSMDIEKTIWVGPPQRPVFVDGSDNPIFDVTICPLQSAVVSCRQEPSLPGILEWEWSTTSTNINITGTNEHTAQIVGTSPGFASIKVRTRNACGWSQSAYLMVQIENCNFLHSDIQVFPNPADETLTVSLGLDDLSDKAQRTAPVPLFTATLYDSGGRERLKGESRDGSVRFDTGKLPEGTYFVHIHRGGEVEKRQVVIRH